MRIFVTQAHIDAGQRSQCSTCPVALAINEHLTPGWRAHVMNEGIDIQQGNEWPKTIDTPRRVAIAVQAFDNGGEMLPFTFSLKLPPDALKFSAGAK